MKSLIAILLVLVATSTVAIGTTPPVGTSDPSTISQSSAGAAQKQGQQQGQGQDQSSTSGANVSTSSGGNMSRSLFWVFPAPGFTPPMAKVDCPAAQITQHNRGLGWNFAYDAASVTDSSFCATVLLLNSYIDDCQYGSAGQLKNLLAHKLFGDKFKASATIYVDLTREECAKLKLPVLPPAPMETIYVPPVLPVTPPKAPPKKRVPDCEKVLTPKSVWACKAAGKS